MKLSEIKIPTTAVTLSTGDEIPVRGLSFNDITSLYSRHSETLEQLFSDYGEDEFPTVRELLSNVLLKCPELCAAAICIANDDPQAEDVISRLAMMDQTNLLVAVCELTFRSEEDVVRALGVLTKGMNFATNLMKLAPEPNAEPDQNQNVTNTSTDTEKPSASSKAKVTKTQKTTRSAKSAKSS